MSKATPRALALTLILVALMSAPLYSETTPANTRHPDKLIIAVSDDRPPYTIRGPLGSLSGYDVDVAHAIARQMGKEAQIKFVPPRKIPEALESGQVDAAIGIEPSKRLEQKFLFTVPVITSRLRLFVHEELSFVQTLKDLRGLRIGINRTMDIRELLGLVPGVRFTPVSETRLALRDIMERRLHVYLGDEFECRYFIRVDELNKVRMVGGALMLTRRSIAVSRRNEALFKGVDSAIQELQTNLALERLHRDWIGRALAPAEMQRRSLIAALAVLAVIATALLAVIIWNQRLENAVTSRTTELKAEHEHFQNIFDHASDGIVVLDPIDTRIMEANQAFVDIMGCSKDELKTVKLGDQDASHEKHFVKQIRTVFQSGESIMFESKLTNHLGLVVDLLIHARSLPFKGRRMVEAITRDMTERKKIEELKDTILQDVSHELKTPLSKMAMSIDLLERNLSPKAQSAYGRFFDICHKSIARLESTITGILNISKLEAESFHVASEKFVVQDVLTNVIDELQMFAQKKGVELKHEYSEGPLYILGDIEMIHRLFVNIIHNAIKFTDKGEVKITASRDEHSARVAVKDQGLGLQQDELERIFGRFYQKTPSYEGCGIGLTIAQKIVTLHEGKLWAESEGTGKGTTLIVRLPLEESKA